MSTKKGTVLPKTGTVLPSGYNSKREVVDYAGMVSAALRTDLGRTHGAAKTVMQWTGASERTVKNWFAGAKGPSGEHLVTLIRHSDPLLDGLLRLSGRDQRPVDRKLIEARAKLRELLELINQLADSDR
jgi:hypothetical protein